MPAVMLAVRKHLSLEKEGPSTPPARVTKPEATCLNRRTAGKRVIVNEKETSMTNTLALLGRLKSDMPELWSQAEVVGQWVWLEFNVPPLKEVRHKLKELGFHWNPMRQCWQHPCGASTPRSSRDPKDKYEVVPATALELNEATGKPVCDTPDKAAEYWRLHVATNPYFNPECECFAALLLNTRRRVKGHQLISIGTLDTILVSPREVFRGAVIAAAAAIVIMHNHPSGEPKPSDADVKVTRDLIRAGQLLKIEVLDHVIVGHPNHCSLRELGYFAA